MSRNSFDPSCLQSHTPLKTTAFHMELFYALSKPSCIHSLNQGEVSVYEALWITNSTLTINQSQSRTWLIYCFPWVIPITKTNRNSACWLRQSLMIDPHQLISPSSLFPLHIDRTRGCIFQRGEMKAYWRQSRWRPCRTAYIHEG